MRKLWNKPITFGNYFTICGAIVGIYAIFLGDIWVQYRKSMKVIGKEFTDNLTEKDDG